jgi:hypothetical protein
MSTLSGKPLYRSEEEIENAEAAEKRQFNFELLAGAICGVCGGGNIPISCIICVVFSAGPRKCQRQFSNRTFTHSKSPPE